MLGDGRMTARGGWLWMIGALVAALAVFSQHHHARELRTELERLEDDLAERREKVRVLEAEWSYLSRPERIKDLAGRHLEELVPVTVRQLSRVSGIPLAPPPIGIGTVWNQSGAGEEGL